MVSALEVVSAVVDPELPFLTIADLGILRSVTVEGGTVKVTLTPTYSGCPALDTIREDVLTALRDHGFADTVVETLLSPAWTTDWLSDGACSALADHGIAPPSRALPSHGPVDVELCARPERVPDPVHAHRIRYTLPPRCPLCQSDDTEETARFGSTACKALWRCRSCREPFEQFKAY